jgi:hypothetical protein
MKIKSVLLIAALLGGECALAQAPDVPPEVQAARAAVRKACASDMQSLCGDKQGREAMQCLRTNSDKLSPDCKDALAKLPRRPPPPPAQ